MIILSVLLTRIVVVMTGVHSTMMAQAAIVTPTIIYHHCVFHWTTRKKQLILRHNHNHQKGFLSVKTSFLIYNLNFKGKWR